MYLKQKIKNLVKSNKPDENLLLELSNFKKKFTNSSKINYKLYNKLTDVECSVYRYNNFLKNNMPDYAEKESKFLMDLSNNDSEVLEGGINNIKYIWRTEPNACEKCQELDGTVYILEEDIPEKPHPNCKCYIEEIPSEKCDCHIFFDNIEDVLSEAESLQNEISNEKEDINRVVNNYAHLNSNFVQGIINDIISLEDPLNILYQTISIFLVNYYQMRDADTYGADKYFHAKANCEAAQKGIVGEMIAKAIGDLREITDNYNNIYIKKYTLEKSLKDIQEDLEANQEGRDLGRQFPTESPYELLKHRIPNGFPDRYRDK